MISTYTITINQIAHKYKFIYVGVFHQNSFSFHCTLIKELEGYSKGIYLKDLQPVEGAPNI